MADDLTLSLDGALYGGWTEVSLVRGVDSLVGSFQLQLADRERTGDERWPLRAGSACELTIDGELVLTGWVDRLSPSIDAANHPITISGRDRAADLIDCSAIGEPGSWRNTSIETIARELARPFGIALEFTASTAPNVRRFALQQGESPWAAIERLARYRGLTTWSLANGTVRIGNPSDGPLTGRVVEGENLLQGSADHDVSERFSEYLVKGQASGSDRINGAAVATPSARATDGSIGRYRPLLVIGEEQSDIAALQKRARWEANVRAARSQPCEVFVTGWRDAGGSLWQPGNRVELTAPSLYVDSEMLITSTEHIRDGNGTVTRLGLQRPEALAQLPVAEDADASAIGVA